MLNTEVLYEVSVLVCKKLFVFYACLIKEGACYLTVRTGCRREKIYSVSAVGGYLFFTYALSTPLSFKNRIADIVNLTVSVFLTLTVVPVLDRTVVTGYTAVYLGFFSAIGTGKYLARDISVILTYRIGWRKGVIRKLEVLCNLLNEVCSRLPIGKLFTEEGVEYSTRGVESLKLVLYL